VHLYTLPYAPSPNTVPFISYCDENVDFVEAEEESVRRRVRRFWRMSIGEDGTKFKILFSQKKGIFEKNYRKRTSTNKSEQTSRKIDFWTKN